MPKFRCEVFIRRGESLWGMGGLEDMGIQRASQSTLDKLEKVGIIEEK